VSGKLGGAKHAGLGQTCWVRGIEHVCLGGSG
jgi:hypothetical protein